MSSSTDAKAALEQSKEGRHFLELITKCPDIQLATALIAAGAKLLTVGASGKENALPAPTAPDLSAALLTLKGLSFINPRGRFDLIFSKDALYLSNAKGNIVVPTTLLTHVAILDQIPQDTKKRCLLFLVLDRNGPSVMNGKQRLEVIIVQTLESDAINTRASTGEAMEGPVAAVLCQAVGMCVPNFTNFLAPDPELYRSARGHVAVHAVVKVSPGHLFPLPGALLFAERPALFLPHRDILAVEYRRPQSATFDLVLHTQTRAGGGGAAEGSGGEGGGGDAAYGSGGGSVQQVEFSQIDRGELGRLQSYFSASRIKLYDPAAPPGRGGAGTSGAARGGAGAGPSGAAAGGVGGGADYHDEEDEDEDDDEDFDPTSFERLESGRRPAKRLRSEPSGSVAASNLPGAAAAGPGGSRDVQMGELAAEGGESEEEEEEEDEEEDEEESSYDEEDELADLEDEDDLRADDVRQRVRQTGGGGGGGSAAGGAGPSSGRGGAPARGGRKAAEEEEEEYDDDDDDDE